MPIPSPGCGSACRGARRDGARGRRARTWIIQHCPPINRLVLEDVRLLLLRQSWKPGRNKQGERQPLFWCLRSVGWFGDGGEVAADPSRPLAFLFGFAWVAPAGLKPGARSVPVRSPARCPGPAVPAGLPGPREGGTWGRGCLCARSRAGRAVTAVPKAAEEPAFSTGVCSFCLGRVDSPRGAA